MLRCVNAVFARFLICIYSRVEPVFCNLYSFIVKCVIGQLSCNLLALSSLRLPSLELADNQKLGDDTGVAFWLQNHS